MIGILKRKNKKLDPIATGPLRTVTGAGGKILKASDVVVEPELIRMRAQRHRLYFTLHLVVDPGYDHVLGEDIPPKQEVMIALQGIECLLE
jgi:hypothetical protein